MYNETSHQGNLRRIVVKVGFETKQVMIVLVTKERKFPHRKELLTELQQQIPNLTTIVQNIQPKPSNTGGQGQNSNRPLKNSIIAR